MRSLPYLDRLDEAYAAAGGIPDRQITLDIEQVRMPRDIPTVGMRDGHYTAPAHWDGLVLTPDIWLSLYPAFIDAVRPLVERWEPHGVEMFWHIGDRLTGRFEVAMARLFNLSREQAEDLFGMRGDEEADGRSDKQVFLDRIATFLREHGRTVATATEAATAPARMRTGFGVLAAGSDTPGAETFDTEASASAVNPIVHEQSVAHGKRHLT